MYAAAYMWAKVIRQLEEQLTEITVSAWLDDAEVVELTEDRLVIYSPSDFRQEFIRQKLVSYIRQALEDLFHTKPEICVWGDSELLGYRDRQSASAVSCNPQFTFGTFITGPSNLLAVRSAQAAAKNPGSEVYNPLYIYGPSGVGKTHLLYAMANELRATLPDKKVVCMRGDQFTNELISAIQSGHTTDFKKKCRQADVFLIDDIHFIAGKQSTQEEFFHTFNELYEHKKQIVMTSDRRPGDMATLEERLRSRFGEGVMVSIDVPDYATRLTILRAKAERMNLTLDEETTNYLAQSLAGDVRHLEGALKKLHALSELSGTPLNLANTAIALKDFTAAAEPLPVTAALVLRSVCRFYGLELAVLKSPQKGKDITEARQIAMYLLRKMTALSSTAIGRELNRDHGTVLHAIKKITDLLTQPDHRIEAIIREITSSVEHATH